MMEQGRTQQPTIDGSSKGKQWLAMRRGRGQWLAMAKKGGGSQRRDICKRKFLDVLGFVKIMLREQTQQSTNSWRQSWVIMERTHSRGRVYGEGVVPLLKAAN